MNRNLEIYKIPIYKRSEIDDLSILNHSVIVHHSKNRESFDELYDEISQILQYKLHKKYDTLTFKVWRLLDAYYEEAEEFDIEEFASRLYFLADLNNCVFFRKTVDLALLHYRKRDIKLSPNYISDEILTFVFRNLEFSRSEQRIIDWAEENIPNIIKKVIAAILNRNSFISFGYLLPCNAVYTNSEKQKLYKFRRILLQKFALKQKSNYIFSNNQSPELTYTQQTYDILHDLLPVSLDELHSIRDQIKEISNEISQLKHTQAQNVLLIKTLNQKKKNSLNFHDILQCEQQLLNLNHCNTSSVDQLLVLYSNRFKRLISNSEYQNMILFNQNYP